MKSQLITALLIVNLLVSSQISSEAATFVQTVEYTETVAETDLEDTELPIDYENADIMIFFAISVLCGIVTSFAIWRKQ